MFHCTPTVNQTLIPPSSDVRNSSELLIQVFDQRKFKRQDQGFLGSVSVKVGDVLDLNAGGHGACCAVV